MLREDNQKPVGENPLPPSGDKPEGLREPENLEP